MIRSIPMIVLRSMRQHRLSTVITALAIAMSSGLGMAVFSISMQSKDAFGGEPGWDAILGAKGSPTQHVLNTVFHMDTSPGTIPWQMYEEIKQSSTVTLAIPYALGDNFRNYRIIGTTEELFTKYEYRTGKKYEFQDFPNSSGRVFDPLSAEAIIGSTVADDLGLVPGSTFQPAHGLKGDQFVHPIDYTVIEVMEPTNTPADRIIWIPIEGIFRMPGHEFGEGDDVIKSAPGVDIPDTHKRITAVMLKTVRGTRFATTAININKGDAATMVWPVDSVMYLLIDKLGWVNLVLEAVAYLVMIIAAGSLLAALYNTMNERRREFAILRALGARKSTVFTVIVSEAGAIAFLGAVLGFAVYFGILLLASSIVRGQTGVVLDLGLVHPSLYWTPLAMVLLGALAGLLPAFKAYSTDVAGHLTRA